MKKGLKNISIAISIVATTALFSGCGGTNSSENLTTTSKNSFNPTKIDREWYHGVNSDDSNSNISFEIDNSTIKISISDISAGEFRHNQFFINTDNNTSSGYEGTGGADYLIEDSHIFKSTGRGWSWNYVGEVDNIQISDDLNSVEVTLNKNILDQLTNQISIISFQVDANWLPIKVTQKSIDLQDNNQNNRLTREEAIKIVQDILKDQYDYRFNKDSVKVIDNNTISYIAYNIYNEKATTYSNHIYKISENSDQILGYIAIANRAILTDTKINCYSSSGSFEHSQVFINSDANPQTGYAKYHGADYLIEDGHLYRSTGRGWSWQYIKDLDYKSDYYGMTVHYQQGDLGELKSNNFMNVVQYNIILNDKNWNSTKNFYTGPVDHY